MLTFTVVEIAPQDGYAVLRIQVGSDSLDVTTGDVFNVATTPEIADRNQVGMPFVF
jgi:hypothetical protein